MNFGQKLREIRLKEDLSLADLARQVQTSPSTLSKYESSEMLPKIDMLISICSVLNCSPNEMLGFKREVAFSPIANQCASIVESMTWAQKQWAFLTIDGIKNGLSNFEKSALPLLRNEFLEPAKS